MSYNTEFVENSITSVRSKWWTAFVLVILLTITTRFYQVTEPDHVCWDETHFGKMASWYINRTFFFDVHPPLGKMLIGLSGYLTGYDGSFPFEKPGDKYNETKYEGMRYFCTSLGAAIIPLAFDIVFDLTRSIEASVIASGNLIFDVGLITLNQYILLDPILLFFLMCSIWGMVKVSKATANGLSYTGRWWSYLFITGTSLSCTISVKFVGLFVVILVGLHTVYELWIVLGDLCESVLQAFKQLVCRGLTLIIWPIVMYVFIFYIHLTILNRSGNGDGFYSSAFQSQLLGNSLHNASMPREIAFGAIVTIKNFKTGGGYLHSHYHLYPKGMGAKQQQVTTYTHKDENNLWLIKPYNSKEMSELRMLKHGDLVRLEHIVTKRNLHSHNEAAPITKKHFQVTGYGENGVGDANDIWRVLVVGGKTNSTIQTVTSRIMFVHYLQNCVLTASGKQLPKWGFEQQEVSCNVNLRDKSAVWNIEDNKHKHLPNVNFSAYAPGFFARFMESHAVMLQGNAGLKPKEGEITSRPWQWPLNYRGQFFSGSVYRIYLLGNPIIWWNNLVFLAIFSIVFLFKAIRNRRRAGKFVKSSEAKRTNLNQLEIYPKKRTELQTEYLKPATWLFIGWILHYLPFWAMGRVLYFHHYFPALLFNSLLTAVMFQYVIEKLPGWLRHFLRGALLSVLILSFTLFSPLAYGMRGPLANQPNSTMHGIKWLSTWEF